MTAGSNIIAFSCKGLAALLKNDGLTVCGLTIKIRNLDTFASLNLPEHACTENCMWVRPEPIVLE